MRFTRGDVRDVYAEHGRAAVFVRDQVIVLSEIATRILMTVPGDGSIGIDAIVNDVVADFGVPEPPLDARDLTLRHVLDLVAHGVLASDSAVDDEPFTEASVNALRSALRHFVSGDSSTWHLPAGVSGPALVAAAERHRVTPTLAAALPVLEIPPTSAARLSAMAAQETATVEKLAAELAEIVRTLEQADVRVLAFKGLALAVQAHHAVAARGTGDHDLLVSARDLNRACAVLGAAGWSSPAGFPRPGDSWAWNSLARNYYELPLVGGLGSIDLHWHVGPVRSAFPDFDVLWSHRASVRIAGHRIPTLSPYDALAHSGAHSAKDHWRWIRGLLDVRLLMNDPCVWQSADRPLRQDQLLSLGLAARIFGPPAGAPAVVHEAMALAEKVWDTATRSQAGPSHVDAAVRVPGSGLIKALSGLRRAGGDASDMRRQVQMSLIPPTYAADLRTSAAWVAIPCVVDRRCHEVVTLWVGAARRRLRQQARSVTTP